MASSALRFPIPQAVAATTVGCSFMLVGTSFSDSPASISPSTYPAGLIHTDTTSTGHAITQSYITVPALLVDFPSLGHPSHAPRATLLGHQWPLIWVGGNNVFRPASAVGVLGYCFAAWSARKGALRGDWRLFALGAVCHVGNVVYSAVAMQPLNDRIDALRRAVDKTKAVQMARDWIRGNRWRVVFPLVAGTATVVQAFLM